MKISWRINRSWFLWRWNVVVNGSETPGTAFSRRSAMRQVEQVIRLYNLAAATVSNIVATEGS